MLIGIPPLIGPELLQLLSRMGHGDSIVLADAHFPGESCNARHCVRMDGVPVAPLLDAVLRLLPLDTYIDDPLVMMSPVPGDTCDPDIQSSYERSIRAAVGNPPPIRSVDRFAFYERARKAFVIVMTGETGKYGNILIVKGVTPPYHVPAMPSQ